MKRDTSKIPDGTILWKKEGGGTFRLPNGKIIKPNQIFRARPDEIPLGFRDVVVAQEPVPPGPFQSKKAAEQAITTPGINAEYSIKPNEADETLFDIVDVKGKVINELGLEKEAAESLLKGLQQ